MFNRHTIRLRGYDYSSAGWYFVTICTKNRECWFGDQKLKLIALNQWGLILQNNTDMKLDEFVIMPNHIHGIIVVGARLSRPLEKVETKPTLGKIIAKFKYQSTKSINDCLNGKPNGIIRQIWRRNYYERIIRSEKELNNIRRYIQDNPANWEMDVENPTI